MAKNGKFGTLVWHDHAMSAFEDNVPNFSLLLMWCVLPNVTQNCNGTSKDIIERCVSEKTRKWRCTVENFRKEIAT
jgi:hypothetical protein